MYYLNFLNAKVCQQKLFEIDSDSTDTSLADTYKQHCLGGKDWLFKAKGNSKYQEIKYQFKNVLWEQNLIMAQTNFC